MLPKEFSDALKVIAQRLKGKPVQWALIASANCCLQGLSVVPKDLDLVTDMPGLDIFEREFTSFMTRARVRKASSRQGLPDYWDLHLRLNHIDVQICGESKEDVYLSRLVSNQVTHMQLDSEQIPCLSLQAEVEACRELGRIEKSVLIEEYLAKRHQ
jgi:hypothetical protein